ncbi:MFS transporter, partial [Arthrospira platensis SPKY1]|nr:MFS transporter [Arthrospira platensis SPKY1]
MLDAYGRLLKDPRFVLYVCLLAMTSATFYAFLGAAPLVLGSYGVGPDGIGFYIMFVPGSYIVGNFLTSHLVHRLGDQRMMWMGQALTAVGIGLMLVLALAGFNSPLALALPLMLMGLGNGFMVPPALAGTVGLMPALAGSAAAVAGLMQQL